MQQSAVTRTNSPAADNAGNRKSFWLAFRKWLWVSLVAGLAACQSAFAGLPVGWTDVDVGFPVMAGSASFSGGTWSVSGAGRDISGSADQFNFVYSTQLTNYSAVVARIVTIQNTDPAAKAGVMYRDTTDGSSAYAMVYVTPSSSVTFQWRNSYGAQSASSVLNGISAPLWVKLVRSGNDFAGYYSPDGAGWTSLGPTQTVPMATNAPVGLAVTSRNTAQLNTATFDNLAATNAPAPPAPPPLIFGVYRQLWTDIYGGTLDALTNIFNNPYWPDMPNDAYTKIFTNVETEVDMMDYYGQRLRAFVVPPTNGTYTFWISSDDSSELYLSSNEFSTNAALIAWVPGWTASREWTKYAEQQSAPIYLEAGRRYYLEALMDEGSGGDNLAVRWQMPDGTIEEPLNTSSLAGTKLVPYDGVDLKPGVYQQVTNLALIEGRDARFWLLATNKSPVSYQWTVNNQNILGATNPVYAVSNVTVAINNGQVYKCMLTNSAGWTNTTPVTLGVTADTVRPVVLRTFNIGATNVQVTYSEPVELLSATNTSNYVFTNALPVIRAVLSADNTSVTLTTLPLVYGSNYTLVINRVRDRALIPNVILTNTTVVFTAAPVATQDVGSPPIPTVITVVSNGVDIAASGSDVGGTADQFGFGYSFRSGNFDVAVRLAGLSLPDLWAKAGLMARESVDPRSRFAAIFATPGLNGCFFEWRDPAYTAASTSGKLSANFPYTWLRLKRSGNVFTGFAGYDGLNWMQLGATNITLPAQVYFGMAVSSHNSSQVAFAQFRDLLDVTNAVVGAIVTTRESPGPSSRKTPIVITEIMYKPAPRTDANNLEFVEIYNSNPWFHDIGGYRLSANNLSYTFPPGTTIQGGSYIVVAASPANLQAVYGITNVMGPYTGSLQRPDMLQLWDEQGALLLTIPYNNEHPLPVATDGTGHSLVLANPTYGEADPQAWDISDAVGGSPGQMDPYRPSPLRNVVINEWLAHTDPPDWDYIELYNHANQPVDISGCILTDSPTTNKYVIPADTVIPAHGFLWFSETNTHVALNAAGENIYFKSADLTRVIDAVEFGAQENGVAMGRWPDGANDFYRLTAKTPGTNNAAIRISNVVINELMYHPISGNDDDQYVELYNRGSVAVNLGGWELSDGVSFTFPSNTVIAADGYLVVARNAARLRTNYSNLTANNCLGDFNGRLAHSGERVALRMPDTILNTNNAGVVSTNLIHIAVNSVAYGTGGKWGQWSDGGGSSLELLDPNSNNRLSANWGDSDETTKSSWANIELTGVLDNGANYETGIQHAQIGIMDRGECLVDNVEVRDGTTGANLVLNPDFETGVGNWDMQGAFSRSSLEASGYGGSSRSLHIRGSGRLWTGANSCQMELAQNGLGDGSTGTLRFKGRWLRGWPEVIMRLNGNWLEVTGTLPVPANLGTPGARNSRFVPNAGPAIYAVTHSPALPQNNQNVLVTARVHDPSAISSIQLFYRLDPTIVYSPILMKDDGTGSDAIANDGIYTASIAGQPAGTLAAFYVSATDAQGASTRYPALRRNGAPEPECLVRFGDDEPGGSFPAYHLWVNATNSQRWYELSDLSNEEHDCTMVSGKRVIYNLVARFAGSPYHQGFDYPDGALCHYKWTFPDDDKFLGATSFNKIHQPGNGAGDDGSIQREQLANTLLRKLGVPWLYRHHVAVYVNGNRRGTLMEDAQTPDADIVEQYFPADSDGWLYKMQPWFEFGPYPQGISIPFANMSWCNLMPYTTTGGAKKAARYRYMFLVRRTPASANDYTNVFSLVDAAGSYGTPNYVASMENLADMENWMRVFAANHAAGNWDAYGAQNSQNLYGYMGTKGTRYSLLMFDFNIVFGNSGSWGPGQNLFAGNSQDSFTANIYNEPTFRRMYWRALQELVNGPLDVSQSGPLLDAKYKTFVMNGLSVENPDSALKSWLASARTSIASQLAAVNAGAFRLDGGYTLSNNVAFFTGTAPINVRSVFVNGAEYPISWTSLTRFRIAVPLQPGNNALSVVAVDAHNVPISGTTTNVSATYNGTVPSPVGQVVITEIMYQGAAPGGEYVEFLNTSTNTTFDLSNWKVNGLGYTFPPGASIAPKSYRVLAANAGVYAATYGATAPPFDIFPGNLQQDGETLTLVKTNVTDLIIDRVRYGTGLPWPAAANLPGTSLQLVDLGQDHWRVANWSAASTNMTADPQWVYVTQVGTVSSSTLYLYLQSKGDIYIDDIKLVTGGTPGVGVNLLPDGDFESGFPGPWIVSPNLTGSTLSPVIKHSGTSALHLIASSPGADVSTSLYQVLSPALISGQTYSLSFWYLQSPNAGPLAVRIAGPGLGVTVNPAPPSTSAALATPAAANSLSSTLPPFPPLWINELQAENLTGITNKAGQRVPWVELFNPTTNSVSLNGLVLADNYTNLMQWPFPSAAVIGPREFKIVFADGQPNLSTLNELHTSFRLAPGAGTVALSRVTTNGLVHVLDYLAYTNLTANRSFGSAPDAQVFDRREFFYVTPGATNNATSAPLTVAINEWMADNANTLADPADEQYEDWFELYNYGNSPVDLYDFYLSDSITNKTQYHITDHYLIPAKGFLLVWADGEAGQNSTNRPDLHVNFKLAKEGEAIGLFGSDGTTIDYVEFGPQTTDVSMGRVPDGGNTVDFLTVATPRTNNVGNTPPVLAPIAGQAVFLGQAVTVQASATDSDQPAQVLTFSLGANSPAGASIEPSSGLFRWVPNTAPSTNLVTIVVTDSGVPARSASQSFTVVVYSPPELTGFVVSGTQLTFGFSTVPGRNYQVEYSDTLAIGQWLPYGNPILGTGDVISITADITQSARRFYRVTVR